MTPIEFFYKVGQTQALLEKVKDVPFDQFLEMYPPQMRGYVSSIFNGDNKDQIKDRAAWFAENFLKNSGGLDQKLLRLALKKSVAEAADTLGEGAEVLTGPSRR